MGMKQPCIALCNRLCFKDVASLLLKNYKIGGNVLNTGCVPIKALIRAGKILSNSKRAKEFKLTKEDVDFDSVNVMEHVQDLIKQVELYDSVEHYANLYVECIQGSAKVISPCKAEVNGKILTTKGIIGCYRMTSIYSSH